MSDVTLTEFLLARIAEDEVFAREHVDASHLWWLPERVLAECAAKRRIVERCASRVEDIDDLPLAGANIGADVLRALALPYADHDDYREEWTP